MKFVLASASDRRIELLSRIIDDFTVMVSDFDESSIQLNDSIEEYVEEIALGKAKVVSQKVEEDSIIIAADTVVVLDSKILGKPLDKEDAINILSNLSGRSHKVYTSLVLINNMNGKVLKETVPTEVKFSVLTEDEITTYINSGEPMDKAGAYGIQGKGGVFVEEIKGCYYNVVGLPLNRLRKLLLEII